MRRVAFLVLLLAVMRYESGAAENRPFTVTDSIAMTRLVDPDITWAHLETPTFKLCPDESKFIIVTRKGHLVTDRNRYSLVLFDVSEVHDFVNSPDYEKLPPEKVLATFETSSDRHAIDAVRWLPDGKRLAFIGRGIDGIGQVYVFDLTTRELHKLTDHAEDIVAFDLAWEPSRLIYSAYAMPNWDERNKRGYAVKSDWVRYLSTKDPRDAVPDIKHFALDLKTATVTKIGIEPSLVARELSISPTGRWAVVLNQVQRLPTRWSAYAFIHEYLARAERMRSEQVQPSVRSNAKASATEIIEDDAFGNPAPWINQFQLVDLKTGGGRPLLDAPANIAGMVAKALWSQDGTRVLLVTTFLPLDVQEPEERDRRRRLQTIAEVEIETGRFTRVTDINERTPDGQGWLVLTGVSWQPDGSVIVRQREEGKAIELPLQRYRKVGRRWVEATSALVVHEALPTIAGRSLQIQIVQDMNASPEVGVTDLKTRQKRLITDLNPQLRTLALGRIEIFDWTDRLGRRFSGGLVFPPNYQAGRRYPVVIQTYGFSPEEFLVDGPNGMMTAYSARAIANKDILVLQMPLVDGKRTGNEKGFDENGENPRFVAGVEGVIDALDARGLIDRNKVGLIGFSREGMHVHYAVTFSKYAIAAATIADSIAATPLCYALIYGFPYPGMLEFENDRLVGAPFLGDGIKLWSERSPVFHLDRIRTPLRYEVLGTHTPCDWDSFAILKRHRRPVEMIHIPIGSHRLQTPYARYTSQQGNVDWFAFWLSGEEDSDPKKAAQYERWHTLRKQHEAHLADFGARAAP